jgi:hypothetical protein
MLVPKKEVFVKYSPVFGDDDEAVVVDHVTFLVSNNTKLIRFVSDFPVK